MQELTLESAETGQDEKEVRIEPEWTDSEWFQVWLELARRPHQAANPPSALQPAT
jgi:hypothetical protein